MTLDEARRRYPPMWVVYERPSDFPNSYVARLWYGSHATNVTIIAPELEGLREQLAGDDMVKLERDSNDDPKIVEVWI